MPLIRVKPCRPLLRPLTESKLMRYLISAAVALLALTVGAQAQLQFGSGAQNSAPAQAAVPSGPIASPGIAWLQSKPASLFDIGMMELTNAAIKSTTPVFDITGAVAEYQPATGLISISFFARTAYSEQNCDFVVRKLRDNMFPQRDNQERLASDLGSYFSSYGPGQPDRPATTGTELITALRFAVYMPGGACIVPLIGKDETTYWKDPNAPAPQVPAATTQPSGNAAAAGAQGGAADFDVRNAVNSLDPAALDQLIKGIPGLAEQLDKAAGASPAPAPSPAPSSAPSPRR